MKTSKIFGLAAVVLYILAGYGKLAAQESVLLLMKDTPQQLKYNPALTTTSRGYFILPGIGGATVTVENTGFGFSDLYLHDQKTDEWKLNLDHLADNFKGNDNVLHLGLDVPILASGVTMPKMTLFWSLSNKTIGELTLPKNILDLRYGNYDYDNNRVVNHELTDLAFKVMNYNEIAFGGNYQVTDYLTIGATVKYLSGLISASSEDLYLKFETVDNGDCTYSMNIKTRGKINVAAPVKVKNDADGYVDDVELETDGILGFITKNMGFGFDLGAKMNLLDNKLRVGISAVDLGFINWKIDNNTFETDNQFTYKGKDVGEIVTDIDNEKDKDYWNEIGEELSKFKNAKHNEGNSFKTKLSPLFMAFGEYEVLKWMNVGAVASLRVAEGKAMPKATANISLRPVHQFNFVFSMGMHPGRAFAFGSAIQATAGPVQFVLASDRMNFNLPKTRGTQLTLGINFLLGPGSQEAPARRTTAAKAPRRSDYGGLR